MLFKVLVFIVPLLVFMVHCGTFREQKFHCTGRIMRLRQPFKWLTL